MHNVVVTGGTRGLGLAIARKLAAENWRVIAVARAPNDAFLAAVAETPESLHFRAFDLSDIEAIPRFAASLTEEFGKWHGPTHISSGCCA